MSYGSIIAGQRSRYSTVILQMVALMLRRVNCITAGSSSLMKPGFVFLELMEDRMFTTEVANDSGMLHSGGGCYGVWGNLW